MLCRWASRSRDDMTQRIEQSRRPPPLMLAMRDHGPERSAQGTVVAGLASHGGVGDGRAFKVDIATLPRSAGTEHGRLPERRTRTDRCHLSSRSKSGTAGTPPVLVPALLPAVTGKGTRLGHHRSSRTPQPRAPTGDVDAGTSTPRGTCPREDRVRTPLPRTSGPAAGTGPPRPGVRPGPRARSTRPVGRSSTGRTRGPARPGARLWPVPSHRGMAGPAPAAGTATPWGPGPGDGASPGPPRQSRSRGRIRASRDPDREDPTDLTGDL